MPSGDYKFCHEVTPQCPVSVTTYGYYPRMAASIPFITIFGICTVLQIVLGIRFKAYPYMIAAGIGCFGEAVGYGGRIIMHKNPWSQSGFDMQITALVLAPSFLAACIYLTFKHVTRYCGEQYSRLKPSRYTWTFIGGDLGSIVLQALGGGVAAAGGHKHPKLAETGDHLIVAGIAFQVFTMSVAAVLMGEFYWRMTHNRPLRGPGSRRHEEKSERNAGSPEPANVATATSPRKEIDHKRFRIFMMAISFAFLCIITRCIYRIPEMTGGWGGPLQRNETLFYILDGMPIALACITYTIFHPGWFFPPMTKGF